MTYARGRTSRGDKYGEAADVWAIGCIGYEMCMGRRAFEGDSLLLLMSKVMNDEVDRIPEDMCG